MSTSTLSSVNDAGLRLNIATKFVPAQRVICVRSLVKATEYRTWAQSALQQLRIASVRNGRFSKGDPFSILHNHLSRERDIDLEICTPVALWNRDVNGFEVRVIPATRVAFTRISSRVNDSLDDTIRALEALEEYVRNEDLIFTGDPREWYSSQNADSVEVQVPIN